MAAVVRPPVGKKRFCKFCWDRGCPTKECFSHYVKDKKGPNGTIVCPILLKSQCMRCGLIGHTPKYCDSLYPVLTRDNPTGDRTQCRDFLRIFDCDQWIEPIPDHMRYKYREWKVNEKKHALRQREMAASRSRHILCEEFDDDAKEMMIGLVGRTSTFPECDTPAPDRNAPYSDYELEVLAKFHVMREHFPNSVRASVMKMTPEERHALRAMVFASRTVFYSLQDVFYIDRIGPPHANFKDESWNYFRCRDETIINPYGISETDPIVVKYQIRVLTKINEMKTDRNPESRNREVKSGQTPHA